MSEEMRVGPTAPKDPVAKRPYFYIMQGKEIFASPQPGGKGIQFIFEDGGRLIDSAKICGNVSDESVLELLKTTEGFRKLVSAIGVSVSQEESVPVKFVFQMYPQNPGEPSTSIEKSFAADGNEQVIELDEIDFCDTDRCPGQIRYEFEHSGIQASVDVRLYLNPGFTAPEQTADAEIDFDSEGYKAMILRSKMQPGDLNPLRAAIDKARAGEEVTIGLIGGSITQGAGAIPIHINSYARKYAESFEAAYAQPGKVKLLKAGVGGTPSELGMIRFERDILRGGTEKPDIIVIEFAVNDEGDETKGVCFESLVRKCLALPWHPAVIILFAVFSFDWNLQDRLGPVGKNYDLPMVSIMDAVTPQFKLLPAQGRVVSKNQFFYDVFHPSNIGHRIMCDCLMAMTEEAAAMASTEKTDYQKLLERRPVLGADFESVILADRKELEDHPERFGTFTIDPGAFTAKDEMLQCVEMDKEIEPVPEFPYHWSYDGSSDAPAPFVMKMNFSKALLVMKDSGDPAFGRAEAFVDGQKVLIADPLTAGWNHCNALILWNEETAAEHTVEIRMAQGQEQKKFTILGFGIVK